jgi:hypothetical protein
VVGDCGVSRKRVSEHAAGKEGLEERVTEDKYARTAWLAYSL